MQLPMPDDWDGVSTCRWAVCWPNSPQWKAILFGLLAAPSQGRFWDFDTGYFLDLRAQFLPIYTKNFNLPGVIMACDDSGIADALNAIATALANQSGDCPAPPVFVPPPNVSISCYSNSTGGIVDVVIMPDETPVPIFGDSPIVPLPESGFPEGYDDLESYDVDKCRKASKLADDFIASLNNISVVTWSFAAAGTLALGGAMVGLIALPVAAIPVMLLVLIGTVGINAYLVELANYLEDNKEDLVCLLYTGESVQGTYVALNSMLTTAVAFIAPPLGIGAALVQIGMDMMNADTLSTLFNVNFKELYPNADCSCASCEDPTEMLWEFPTDSQGWNWSAEEGDCAPGHTWYDPFNAVYVTMQTAFPNCRQRWTSPVGCYQGNTFEVSLLAQADIATLTARGVVHYADDDEDIQDFVTGSAWNSLPTQYLMDVQDKDVLWVAVEWEVGAIPGGIDLVSFLSNPHIYYAV